MGLTPQPSLTMVPMEPLVIAGKAFQSRLIVGTGKYKNGPETQAALEASGARVVASIWGRRVEEYAAAAALLARAPACVVAVEVNVSCPNLEDRSHMFAHSPQATGEAVRVAAACGRPLWA